MNKKNVEKVLKGVTLAGAAALASTDVVFAETMTMDIDGVEGDDLEIVSETKEQEEGLRATAKALEPKINDERLLICG